jgi:hypothetical protein
LGPRRLESATIVTAETSAMRRSAWSASITTRMRGPPSPLIDRVLEPVDAIGRVMDFVCAHAGHGAPRAAAQTGRQVVVSVRRIVLYLPASTPDLAAWRSVALALGANTPAKGLVTTHGLDVPAPQGRGVFGIYIIDAIGAWRPPRPPAHPGCTPSHVGFALQSQHQGTEIGPS